MDKTEQFALNTLNNKCIRPLLNLEKEYRKMSIKEVEEKLDKIHSFYRNVLDYLYRHDIEPLDIKIQLVDYRKLYNKVSKKNNSILRSFNSKIRRKKS